MVQPKTELSYGLIIFGLALTAFGLSKLLVLGTLVAYWMSGVLIILVSATCVSGIVHYWRYGQHK